METNLSRTPDGVIHVPGCVTPRGATPWLWAQHRSGAQLLDDVDVATAACTKCRPFDPLLEELCGPHRPGVSSAADVVRSKNGTVLTKAGRHELGVARSEADAWDVTCVCQTWATQARSRRDAVEALVQHHVLVCKLIRDKAAATTSLTQPD